MLLDQLIMFGWQIEILQRGSFDVGKKVQGSTPWPSINSIDQPHTPGQQKQTGLITKSRTRVNGT